MKFFTNKMINLNCCIQENLHVLLGFEPHPAVEDVLVKGSGAAKVKLGRPSSAMSQRSSKSRKSDNSKKSKQEDNTAASQSQLNEVSILVAYKVLGSIRL